MTFWVYLGSLSLHNRRALLLSSYEMNPTFSLEDRWRSYRRTSEENAEDKSGMGRRNFGPSLDETTGRRVGIEGVKYPPSPSPLTFAVPSARELHYLHVSIEKEVAS